LESFKKNKKNAFRGFTTPFFCGRIVLLMKEQMMHIDTRGRTDAYVGTFGLTESDQNELKQIRKMVTNLNKDLKQFGYHYRYYVKCQGRGPRKVGDRRYFHSLPLKYAKYMDAYIYRR
jgi:hypothetical protein|tara:strand:- start:7879 stop:8232 length:354 start_codon:yes stop_codon:yes gene_type:complete